MIKANELRIGNWIEYAEGKYIQVEPATIHIVSEFSSFAFDVTYPKPIPLTPEILESINEAKKITDGMYKISNKIIIQNNELGEYAIFINSERVSYLEYKYLHQLQNLYFDITPGIELTINLNVESTI